MRSPKPQRLQDAVFMMPFSNRHGHGIGDNQEADAEDEEGHDFNHADDGAGHGYHVRAKCLLRLRSSFRHGIGKGPVDHCGDLRGLLGIGHADHKPADGPCAVPVVDTSSLVHRDPVKIHVPLIGRWSRSRVDSFYCEFPITRIETALNTDDVTNVPTTFGGQFSPDDAGTTVTEKGFPLGGRQFNFRMDIQI